MSTKERLALSIDLGGTKILAALVTPAGKVVAEEYAATRAEDGPQAVMGRLISAARKVVDRNRQKMETLDGVGLAVAGVLDTCQGLVTVSANLPGWENVPLRDFVSKELGLPAFLVHDADAAALGEQRFGAGRGARNLVYVTVSTGIGGGIIVGGELYSGTNGCAGEVGHMTIIPEGPRCPCGNRGCLEMLASGKAIAREAVRRLSSGAHSLMIEMVRGRVDAISAKTVGEAARNGDWLAQEVVHGAAVYLGIGLANLVNLLNPEMIIIGGGVSRLGDMLLQPAREVVDERAFKFPASTVKIVPWQLEAVAGTVGAAALVFDRLGFGRGR